MDAMVKGRDFLTVVELARRLRQEQLYIQQEQAITVQLSETFSEHSMLITRLAYIQAQEKENLNDASLLAPDSSLHLNCQRAHKLKNVSFVDSKKLMEYEHALAAEDFLNFMYTSPHIVARSLALGDRLPELSTQYTHAVSKSVGICLLGNAVSRRDAEMMLKVLRELAVLQIVGADNPRRMLRANSSAFARLYQRLNDSLFSAKVFLVTALHEPLMTVFSECERIASAEGLGARNGASAAHCNVETVSAIAATKLREHVKLFVDSLASNWALFPSGLRWLIKSLWTLLKEGAQHSDQTVRDIIADLVFTSFICPAIVSPNIVGIVNIQISEKIRIYLMQIVQALQTLALSTSLNGTNPKFAEIQAHFKDNQLAKLIDRLLVGDDTGVEVATVLAQDEEYERTHFMCTQTELQNFVEFFRLLVEHKDYDIAPEERQKLEKLLNRIPVLQVAVAGDFMNGTADAAIEKEQRSKPSIMSLRKITKVKITKTISFSSNNNPLEAGETAMPSALLPNLPIKGILQNNDDGGARREAKDLTDATENDIILLFDMYRFGKTKLLPLTEEEVLTMDAIGPQIPNGDASPVNKPVKTNGFAPKSDMNDLQKGAQFSLMQDDVSIGNSDNLEVVSEAPSNHSVTSSLELEEENDQNDNLSDMVSANVSGRGSPNISGRDTPSSQVTDGGSVHNAMPAPQIQKLLSKARSDIEDKFCKFELKKFEGDETVSIISDTWSTDVLASDSEILEASENKEHERNFSTPLIPAAVVLPGDENFLLDTLNINRGPLHSSSSYMDTSDQRSESNWSTDVLASDSEKCAEVDTDDNASITARSDITDAGVRSEAERDMLAAAISTNVVVDAAHGQKSGGNHRTKSKAAGVEISANVSSSGSSAADNISDRSQEDSAFFDAINHETTASTPEAAGGSNVSLPRFYQGPSSLARSSSRTTNPFNGETSFQWNYKCGSSDESNVKMSAARSAESNAPREERGAVANSKSAKAATAQPTECDDLIDLRDFNDDDSHVERRPTSMEQRNAGFDGRRNGILASQNQPLYRRHQSLNYENHEIMLKSVEFKRASANDGVFQQNAGQTDDDKQKMLLLCAKGNLLNLNDNEEADTETVNTVGVKSTVSQMDTEAEADAEVPTLPLAEPKMDKPTKSTGAIPKSISFDTSADKRTDAGASDMNGQSSIFTKLKQGIFKNRRSMKSSRRVVVDGYASRLLNGSLHTNGLDSNAFELLGDNKPSGPAITNFGDFNEDILAKYRRKVSTSSEATNPDAVANGGGTTSRSPAAGGPESSIVRRSSHQDTGPSLSTIKRKIRMVLSKTSVHGFNFRPETNANFGPLTVYLTMQLAQAINMQNFQQISNISEALRCVGQLDSEQQAQLVGDLQNDLKKRQLYLRYLTRFRQDNLLVIDGLEQFQARFRTESVTCNRNLIYTCVRLYLEKHESDVARFREEFALLTVSDDKMSLIEEFIDKLMEELQASGSMLYGLPLNQTQEARHSIERILFQQIYQQVLFPNDDADISRDTVLSSHIIKLQQVIRPSHPALCIPAVYLSEAPWAIAQKELSYISAYRTPREKLQCITRCINGLIGLLNMSSGQIPAADDILPVLIYVVIMANPPYLLSTIAFISCFMEDKLSGETQFYWTLFESVVQFIKTMDYLN